MKRFVSLFCMLMLVALPFAWAETQVEFLSQQAVPAPASLPDLQLQPLDMQPYENQASTLFPAAEDAQYMLGNRSDEKSYHFSYLLYHDTLADAVYCVTYPDFNNQLPEDDGASLSFLGREEAAQTVVNSLQEHFGITAAVWSECAMTKTLYDELYESDREFLEDDLADGSHMGATEQVAWETEDVCYIFYLYQTVHDTPLLPPVDSSTDTTPGGVKTMGLYGTEIVAMLFPDGIRYLKLNNLWTASDNGQEQPLISQEDAIAIFRENIDEAPNGEPVQVQAVRLMYAGKEGAAHPYWAFAKKLDWYEGSELLMTENGWNLVDAVTGEWIGEEP